MFSYRFLLFTYPDYESGGGMSDVEFKFNYFSDLINEKDDLYLSENIEIYDFEYDNTLYISNKETMLSEFRDYLG